MLDYLSKLRSLTAKAGGPKKPGDDFSGEFHDIKVLIVLVDNKIYDATVLQTYMICKTNQSIYIYIYKNICII